MKYTGHALKGLRDFTKANFNLGSKDMGKALINASLEEQGGMKSNTHKARLPALRLFGAFLKEETSVKRLNHITRAEVIAFGEYLRDAYEVREELTASTARDYLSHVNCALAQARGDEKLKVRATKELQFPSKSGIALYDGSMSYKQHTLLLRNSSEVTGLIARLQRAWGLRFREAVLLDANKALSQLDEQGKIVVHRGTKGGQARTVMLESEEQRNVIEAVARYQSGREHDSLIPKTQSLKAFQSAVWRETQRIDPTYLSHGERKAYAADFYQRHTGVECPVRSAKAHGAEHHRYIADSLGISLADAKALDKVVRLKLSKALGHHRLSITNAYLG